MRRSDLIGIACALGLTGAQVMAETPLRVVSVNLCTDQLALMLADPGQLVAVTRLAQDPRTSAMAEAAQAVPSVHVTAEEIYLMRPDLVLAGTFTARATVEMLRRLGLRVELFPPAYSLADVRDRIDQMGTALGQETRAADLVARFDDGLAALAQPGQGPGRAPRAALYYANGYTSGDNSLAGQILRAAGFANVAEELGAVAALPLEVLVMAAPDVVITGQPYPGASRAEAVLAHPAVLLLKQGPGKQGPGKQELGKQELGMGTMTDRDWICGTPHVLNAIAALADLRAALEARD